jgi:hypothetical protein
MQFGENKIGEDGGLMISAKGGNTLRIGAELTWEADGCKIKWGGYDSNGGKVVVSSEDWYMGQKDGFIYHNGGQLLRIPCEREGTKIDDKKVDRIWGKIKDKVRINIDENAEDIMEINGEKYVDQMMINMILIEKIKQLEAKLAKTR